MEIYQCILIETNLIHVGVIWNRTTVLQITEQTVAHAV